MSKRVDLKVLYIGENYSIFNKETNKMREACDNFYDNDLDRGNSAVTYIWLW